MGGHEGAMADGGEANPLLEGVPGAGISLDGIPGVDVGEMPQATVKEIICSLPKLEEFAKEARACLFQDNFMGGKVDIQKPHSQNFATTHSLMLSPPGEPSDYTFGANFFDAKLLMMGTVKNGRDMSGTVRYEFSKRLSTMFRMQMENGDEAKRLDLAPYIWGSNGALGAAGMDFMRWDIDYKGSSSVSNINMQRVHHCAIPDQMGNLQPLMEIKDDGTFEDRSVKAYQCQFTHTRHITETFCMGASLTGMYQFQGTLAEHDRTRAVPGWSSVLGFRYDPKDYVLSCSLSRNGKREPPNPPVDEDSDEVDSIVEWNALQQLWYQSQFSLKTEYAHKVVDNEMKGGNSIWFAAEYEIDPDLSGMACITGPNAVKDAPTAELLAAAKKMNEADPDRLGKKREAISHWAPSSSASLGYLIQLANNGVRQSTVKGKVNTEGTVTGTIEEQINPLVSLVMSAALDHAKEEYRFGFGIQVGGAM